MKNLLKLGFLVVLICTLSSFTSSKKFIPPGQFVGYVNFTEPSPSGLLGTYKLYSTLEDKTVITYIVKPNGTGLVNVTGTYTDNSSTNEPDEAIIWKDGVIIYGQPVTH